MKGNNQILLNQATMIDAIQHYFDTVLFREGQSPMVCSVEEQKPDGFFLVRVTQEAAP